MICEGETEETYINLLKRHYRVPVLIKTRVSGNAINERLVRQYLKELNLQKGDEYMIFYIYDCDVDCVVDKLKTLPGVVILSNPCFELWYVLHVTDMRKSVSSATIYKLLTSCHPIWNNYTKGRLSDNQSQLLISGKMEAVKRAKNLITSVNPSTNMYEFVEALEREKN